MRLRAQTTSGNANLREQVLVPQLDDERDTGVEPVTVQLHDLGPRGQAAQMQVALAVVEQGDGVTESAPGLLDLVGIGELACDAGEVAAADAQTHAGVGADVPNPSGGSVGALERELRWAQLQEIGPVTAPDHAHAFAPRLAGLAPGGGDHAVAGGRAQHEEGQHQRAQQPAVPGGADRARVLAVLRGSGLAHVGGAHCALSWLAWGSRSIRRSGAVPRYCSSPTTRKPSRW